MIRDLLSCWEVLLLRRLFTIGDPGSIHLLCTSAKYALAGVVIWHERHFHVEDLCDIGILMISEPRQRRSFQNIEKL